MPDDEVARPVETDPWRLMTRADGVATARADGVRTVAESLLGRGSMTAAEVVRVVEAAWARPGHG